MHWHLACISDWLFKLFIGKWKWCKIVNWLGIENAKLGWKYTQNREQNCTKIVLQWMHTLWGAKPYLAKSSRSNVDFTQIDHLQVVALVWHLGSLEDQNKAEITGKMKACLTIWLVKIQVVSMAHLNDMFRENMEKMRERSQNIILKKLLLLFVCACVDKREILNVFLSCSLPLCLET